MNKYNRVFLIVTDGLGIGGDKRAAEFGDKGANTFLHVSETGLLNMPTWKKLGIDSIAKLTGFNKSIKQTAYMARMEEKSNAKDTLAGHWEMLGIETTEPFPVFTETGFPQEMLDELSKIVGGKKILANASYSGTTVLDEFAQDELDDKGIIIYTSGDSVMQICAHEEHTGLDKLYEWCEAARKLCNSKPEWKVGRIIARPYLGSNGKWTRTANRHDYAVHPPTKLITDSLQEAGVQVTGVGKIRDIFDGQGITDWKKGKSDDENMDITINIATGDTDNHFVFVNLVEFDSAFGHRRDADGYAENINRFDTKLAKLINAMKDDDLLLITSDHGNDPSWKGSDHTREHVPVTIFAKDFKGKPKKLDNFIGFATLGNLVAKNYGVELSDIGQDRADEII